MPDGVQRAMTRQIRTAWEIYAVTEKNMSPKSAILAFDNWLDSIRDEADRVKKVNP